MANIIGTRVSNIYAKPSVINDRGNDRAIVGSEKASVTLLVGDVVNANVVLVTAVPWTAKIHSLRIFNDELDTNGTPTATFKAGIYKMAKDGTLTALADACYTTGNVALQNPNTAGIDIAFATRTIDKIEQTVIVDAGLTDAPTDGSLAVFAITFTAAFATAGAGKIAVSIAYT